MTPRQLLKAYFTGRLELFIRGQTTSNRYGRENIAYCQQILSELNSYMAKHPPEIADMERQHYKDGRPFGEFYNIVAPTSVVMNVNSDLRSIVKRIEQPERFKKWRP